MANAGCAADANDKQAANAKCKLQFCCVLRVCKRRPNFDGIFLQRWREGVGTMLAVLIGLVVLFSVFVLLFYASRAQTLYEELTDFLDKTHQVSEQKFSVASIITSAAA